jgi:hypothetical protein
MNSENYENFTENLKYYRKLAEKFWKRKIKQKCLLRPKQLMASAYL